MSFNLLTYLLISKWRSMPRIIPVKDSDRWSKSPTYFIHVRKNKRMFLQSSNHAISTKNESDEMGNVGKRRGVPISI